MLQFHRVDLGHGSGQRLLKAHKKNLANQGFTVAIRGGIRKESQSSVKPRSTLVGTTSCPKNLLSRRDAEVFHAHVAPNLSITPGTRDRRRGRDEPASNPQHISLPRARGIAAGAELLPRAVVEIRENSSLNILGNLIGAHPFEEELKNPESEGVEFAARSSDLEGGDVPTLRERENNYNSLKRNSHPKRPPRGKGGLPPLPRSLDVKKGPHRKL